MSGHGHCVQRLVSRYLANTARERGLHLFCLVPPLLDRRTGSCITIDPQKPTSTTDRPPLSSI
ncbi:uncharacterized protein L969DRAFT_454385 [Mixia osmundae IAM 14324]|uniref:uncharacterized protein n=1 Tax=Mixia osmundae (strain CBS 9802 / IAM 14324 / JCM 22182 / KY 12970) TaxID=764103 RepID=UPI0004A55740|nr:uncharacterized protein L969DRAFT_454385 [Mixia osmundae IAM 14324]KEI39537.1 hypothetical protein L969DRAFT_454385 [Mixia osmundae IAM 14324]